MQMCKSFKPITLNRFEFIQSDKKRRSCKSCEEYDVCVEEENKNKIKIALNLSNSMLDSVDTVYGKSVIEEFWKDEVKLNKIRTMLEYYKKSYQ